MKPHPSPLKGTEVLVNPQALGRGRPPFLERRDLLEIHWSWTVGLHGKNKKALSGAPVENGLISYRELVQREIILKKPDGSFVSNG